MFSMRYLLFIGSLLCMVGWGPFFFSTPSPANSWVSEEARLIHSKADNLNTSVLVVSLNAYLKAQQYGLDRRQLLTVIDYSLPSSERRLWVIDLKNSNVLFNTWVTHGKNSGEKNSTSFSNDPRSLKSSLGVFVTEGTYSGSVGYALRVKGLDRGINDNALNRGVVIHGATYASPQVAKQYGMLGRSWGCMAVDTHISRNLINTIKNNTLVVAYYPDRNWLSTSTFLN
jgi:hypothetical protein